jgi:hypothetical protein
MLGEDAGAFQPEMDEMTKEKGDLDSSKSPSVNGRANSSSRGIAQPIDRIALFHLSDQGIFEKAAPLYASGLSLREVAREIAVSKTTIRKVLLKHGVALRPSTHDQSDGVTLPKKFHVGVAPYGYCVLNGRLVQDPKEQRNVQLILKLRSQGKSLNAIAAYLNGRKVRPRTGKAWDHSIVRSIVQRNQSN